MRSLSSKSGKYPLCVVHVFTKYAWVEPLKDKKAKTVLNVFKLKVDQENFIITICKND